MSTPTVLVIDDIKTERLHLRDKLEGLNYRVIEADGAQQGIDLALAQKPDVILLDVVMPGVSGFQATRMMKRNPAISGIPIVMVTSKNSEPDKENAQENGAVAYIVKPATSASLRAVLDRVLA